jgi:hypothetical protein
MSASFQRRIENFRCEHCKAEVVGTGYTNHCPRCLWSKHVDVNPGDRAASCGGMMKPVRIQGSTPKYRIVHRCVLCGFERINSMQPLDSMEAIARLAGGE